MATAHVASLAAKHAEIEALIGNENRRPMPDATLIATLKKQKLKLKEAMRAG